MSLIGVDLGTSAIKVAAYSVDGTQLSAAHQSITAHRPESGHWEVDVLESRAAFDATLRAVATDPAVRRDPPVAIACSSSGREVFPVAGDGGPLGRCLMTADTRGDEVAAETAARRPATDWFEAVGHVPRRMDPVNRALWWQRTSPGITDRAKWFMNWHEFYCLVLAGRPVVDWSNAGTWATYDLASAAWSPERIAETGIDPAWLPEIQPNGAPIGRILPAAAEAYGLPSETLVVTGAYDAFAAAVGSAAVDPGVIALSCGTWHSFSMAVRRGWPAGLADDGVSVLPHPGPTGFGILITDPNGMSVIDWARDVLGLSIEDLDVGLAAAGSGPGSILARPTLTPLPHRSATSATGGWISGLTLSTSRVDIVRGLLEGIAIGFAGAIRSLSGRGLEPRAVRATGGGSRSTWWLQLQSDLSGLPIEVVDQDEPGAFGAAILAGVGAGVYPSVSSAAAELVRVSTRFEPNAVRAARYDECRARLGAEGRT